MIYIILILLCGVSSHILRQIPTESKKTEPNQLFFLKEYETVVQNLPVQKFEGLQRYLNKNCNLTIPPTVPKFSYAEVNSMLLHYCMGIRDTVERLRNDYESKKLKEPLNEFFNRSSTKIMADLRTISNDICINFNNIVLENKQSQWVGNLRSHFNQSERCNMSCTTGDNEIAEQCIFIYGLHKTLHSMELVNLPTTTHVLSTGTQKSEKTETILASPANTAQRQEEIVKSVKIPDQPLAEKSDNVKAPIKQVIPENLVELPPQKLEENHIAIDNPIPDNPVGVEESQRYVIPTITTTTVKNVVKGPTTVVNQKNLLITKQEVVPPLKSQDEPKSGVGVVENVNQKVPKSQGQETDFENNENEYPVPEFEDPKDDGDFENENGPMIDPKTESHKKVPLNEEDFSKRISSFGTKPVTAQEVDTEIVAYVVEGRPNGRYGRRGGRPNTANYRKLDTNLEEAITSNCNTTSSHVIY